MCLNGKSDKTINVRLMSRILKLFVGGPFPAFENDVHINDVKAFSLSDFGIDGELLHTPGHTNGSISILFPNKTAIIGDVLMGGYLGGKLAPTKPDYHYFVTNPAELHQSIELLLSYDIDIFYVGHGGPLQKKDILKWYSKAKAV